MPRFVPFIFLLMLAFAGNVSAQTWEVGAGIGGAGYIGDLNIRNPVKISGPSGSLFAARNFNGYLSARLNVTYGTISAADSTSSNPQFRQRNLSFTTSLTEISLLGEFNFLNYVPEIGRNKFTPYIFIGIGAVDYSPTTIYNGQKYDLRGIETEGEKKPYPSTAFSIPYGAGIKYNIAGKLTLGAEIGYRTPNTDYLDDVSGNYVFSGHNTLQERLSDRSGEKNGIYIGSPGSQRGDMNPHDTYFFTQITISYTFLSQKCYFQ